MKHTKLMKGLKTIAILLASIITVLLIGISLLVIFGKGQLLLPIPKKEAFELANNHKYAYELRVEGTKIYNELGEQVILSGLMVPEAKILDGNGEFNKQYFEEVFKCGGYAIRIPVHPDEWVEDEYYLWRYLDPIVSWAIEYNKYVILDLHFIGNIQTGEGSEMKDVGKNTYDFSIEFWNMIANYFKDVPNVIFEIYNEPASIDYKTWSGCANQLVNTIRKTGANQLIIVSGVDYSYDLSYWVDNPINDSNIAYAAHIFPNRIGAIDKFDKIADAIPIIVTEWGYIDEDEKTDQKYLVGSSTSYGEPMIQFMNRKGISWIACWYDDSWEPPMFFKDTKEKTDWGDLILNYLHDIR